MVGFHTFTFLPIGKFFAKTTLKQKWRGKEVKKYMIKYYIYIILLLTYFYFCHLYPPLARFFPSFFPLAHTVRKTDKSGLRKSLKITQNGHFYPPYVGSLVSS